MADRVKSSVNTLVLHHAVTPLWEDKSKAWIAQWFSDNGKAQAYQGGALYSGLINPYTGARSYSQAHLAGQRVTSKTPDATAAERSTGYRLVPLVKDIWGMITWHAGNWQHGNVPSISIENLGDYRNYPLRDGDMRVIADFWRPQDAALKGKTIVYGHYEISDTSTACPARIMEARNKIVEYINKSPASTTKPVPAFKKLAKPVPYRTKLDKTELWDLATNPNYKSVKTFNKGEGFIAFAEVKFNDSTYCQSEWSFNAKNKTGINKKDLDQVLTVTSRDEVEKVPIPFTVEEVQDDKLPLGETEVLVQGVDGERTIVTRITFTDGKETDRKVIKADITKQPIAMVIHIGAMVNYPDGGLIEENNSLLKQLLLLINGLIDKITNIFK